MRSGSASAATPECELLLPSPDFRSAREERYTMPSSMDSPVPRSQLVDALSVDVEDYFHVEAFAHCVSPQDWPRFPSRFSANTRRVLELFAQFGCRATFFVLGWVAESDPSLVRDIVKAGHEVGCHSYAHRRVTSLTHHEFREDLRRARCAIEDAGGTEVLGYRAPTFSIGRKSLWALDILAEEGFLYDSSIFPIRHDLYGYPEAPRFPHRRVLSSGRTLIEVPMSTFQLFGRNWPAGGGGYLRILPLSHTRWAIRRIHRVDHQPVIFYLHPWEVDPEQPRIQGGWKSNFRQYTRLSSMEGNLRSLLAEGQFEPMINLVRRQTSLPVVAATQADPVPA